MGRIRASLLLAMLLAIGIGKAEARADAPKPPNIVVIITDDQGYGDLGVHANPRIRTPNLDRLASQGARLRQFVVSPVCSPTRSSLMTGRYNYRTGVVDTYQGRSLMHPEERTLAERLGAAGYRTGIFGKWHLGDNLPLRPIDRGFQEALVLKGGGIGQPSDLPGGTHYLNPVLLHNGKVERFSGYCSDVYTDAAIDFVKGSRGRPFFAYLAFNCPHDPLEAPEAEWESYRDKPLGVDQFPNRGYPLARDLNQEKIAKVYAMVSNIDMNVGRLLASLDAQGIADSTLVLFMTDNGPAFPRYNGGLRGLKGTVYEGGIHVPCFIRWPSRVRAGLEVHQLSAHIDIVPTLLEACGIAADRGPPLDGRSLMPLLRGDHSPSWPERTVYLQWHRGDAPELGRSFTARTQGLKLLRPEAKAGDPLPPLELYDLERDPFEQHDLASTRPEAVRRMYEGYLKWFREVSLPRGFAPARILVGDPRESPTLLTRQDCRSLPGAASPGILGEWFLQMARAGTYDVDLRFPKCEKRATLHLMIGDHALSRPLDVGAEQASFPGLKLAQGPARLRVWLEEDGKKLMVFDGKIARVRPD